MGLTLLLPGLAFGLPALVLTANRPAWWVVITVAAGLLGPVVSLAPGSRNLPLTLFQVSLLFTLFTYVNHKFLSSSLKVPFSSLFGWMAAFIALLFVSTLYSQAREDALLSAGSVIPLAVLALVIADTMDDLKYFRWMFELSVLVMGALSLLSVYTFLVRPAVSLYNVMAGEAGAFWVMGRQVGSYGDPNLFAMLLVFPLVYLLVQLFIRPGLAPLPKMVWLYYAGMFALILGALLTTYSRSAWLSLVVAALAAFLLARRLRRLLWLAVAGAAAMVVLAGENLFIQSLISRGLSVLDASTSGSAAGISNNSRVILALAGLDMFRDSYFLGFGYQSFRALAPHYFDLTTTGGVYAPHNLSIQILAELGLGGFLVFCALVVAALRRGLEALRAADPETRLMLYTVLGYFVAVLCFHQLYPLGIKDNLLWVCLGSIPALHRLANRA